jgi:RNA-directed DNA polymerase
MKRLIDLSNEEARTHFLKGSCYFNGDLPRYISFEPMLGAIAKVLKGGSFSPHKEKSPAELPYVNYSFIANKDGRFSWRPYELIHPVIYVSLVNTICETSSWATIQARCKDFEGGLIESYGGPVISEDDESDVASQIKSWWQNIEQKSLLYSLSFSHLIHTDVVDCYGSLYTHSIPWALHGLDKGKELKSDNSLLGNKIDAHIQAGRYGQTNGIAQGSVLMDFVAEIVLGYVDLEINAEISGLQDVRILRYRDDYRVFANSDERAESVLKIVSDKLRAVGMKLGTSKTISCRNVVEGSIKPDKLAGIELQDLGESNAKTIQKQLLRLHAFGQRFPNSGALKRLLSEFHVAISKQSSEPDDLLSYLISLAPPENKLKLWDSVRKKIERLPYNGYLDIWLQRVVQPKSVGMTLESEERICKLVNKESVQLWDSSWIKTVALKKALDVSKIVVGEPTNEVEVIEPKEVELFKTNALLY